MTIADSLYSCQYGTFLVNSEKLRKEMPISEYTMSAWTPILRQRTLYVNPCYQAKSSKQVLQPNNALFAEKFWDTYYYRYLPDYQPTVVSESMSF